MADKIAIEVKYRNSTLGEGLLTHTSSLEIPHEVPQGFIDKFEAEGGKGGVYAAFKRAMVAGAVANWGAEGKFAVLSSDDENEHIIIHRDDIEAVTVKVVKTIDKA